jgi:plasmid rolling circle replication initiator protein Rep
MNKLFRFLKNMTWIVVWIIDNYDELLDTKQNNEDIEQQIKRNTEWEANPNNISAMKELDRAIHS